MHMLEGVGDSKERVVDVTAGGIGVRRKTQ